MPRKSTQMSDAERAKRIRDAARQAGTSNDPAEFDAALDKIIRAASPSNKTDKPLKKQG